MRKKFYNHQRKAFKYALNEKHPALFMEMRLGKTLVTIRVVKTYKPLDTSLGLRVLTVAPNCAIDGWLVSLEEEGFEAVRLVGSKAKRTAQLEEEFYEETGKLKWFIVNKEVRQTIPELGACRWDSLILDESTFISRASSGITKFFLNSYWRRIPHLWLLTGTPNPEGDDAFVCQILFQYGWFLGCKNFYQFRCKFMEPDPFTGCGQQLKWGVRKQVVDEVAKTAFVLGRKDAGLAETKIYETRKFNFPQKIRKAYTQMEKDFALELGDVKIRTMWNGARWQILRQLCGGLLGEELIWKDKIKSLVQLLKGELARESVVVWCVYNPEIKMITEYLKKKKIKAECMFGGSGGHSQKEQTRRKKLFQQNKFRVFVVQQACANMGVDFSISDTMIYYSSPPGALQREQTEARTTTVEKITAKIPQLIIDMIVEDSVDEDVYSEVFAKFKRSDATRQKIIAKRIKERSL